MKWSNEEINEAIKLLKEGLNYAEIGKELNRTNNSVRVKLQKLGYSFYDELKIIKNCLTCNCEIKTTKGNPQKFCSRSCSAIFNNKNRGIGLINDKKCVVCDKGVHKDSKYCSNTCYSLDRQNNIFKEIENGNTTFYEKQYKKYLIQKYGNKCMDCGWCEINKITGNVPIQLEHIDGNSENNSLNNLKLLCPNCHSLTPTFGALNKGNGREKRRLKRQNKM